MHNKGIVIAGLSGGSGKSIVAVGITAMFSRLGTRVTPFKKGPDYIDAGWLALAAGNDCYNLDPYLMTDTSIQHSFSQHCQAGDIALIEGNRGLYDGVDAGGLYSTAELAVLLQLPVILVVNCIKTTRTVAAMVLGCKVFDKRLDIRGVVLNNIATSRQRKVITEAVERFAEIPVIGAIPRLKRDVFPMRHLGMIPYQEYKDSDDAIGHLADIVEESIDYPMLEKCLGDVAVTRKVTAVEKCQASIGKTVKIGVIQDEAFQFYYPENLNALKKHGAELVKVNALSDHFLPPLDGLYIGGGFPETSARALAANENFRKSLKMAAEDGLPIYAECGGLIYLGESIVLEGKEYPLTGVFPVKFGMSQKPQAHGYSIFVTELENPFYECGVEVKGHEFRYSTILEWRGNTKQLVLKMKRGTGFMDGRDGLCINNVMALYTHIHACGTKEWAQNLVSFCKNRTH